MNECVVMVESVNCTWLGTISSSSPSAGPPDVLIQGSPPHRRARTAAWSYHFYPDEAWVDLTITLPCAVLLKEVIIQPHLSSLASQSSPLSSVLCCYVCFYLGRGGLVFACVSVGLLEKLFMNFCRNF